MATVYKFQVSMPVTDLLPRNRISNTFHMQHVTGGLADAALESMCSDIVAMYKTRYGDATKEISCKAYDTDAVPNYPRAEVTANAGAFWSQNLPREIALCLSFAGTRRGVKSERGRIYLNPCIGPLATAIGLRPSAGQMAWAIDFYDTPNASFPDLGGVDWKFGTYSSKYKTFTQSQQAWCNDDWDIQRRRGLRENTRQSVTREG